MKYPVMFVVLLATTAYAVPGGQFVPLQRPRELQIHTKDTTNYRILQADDSDIRKHPHTVSVYSKSYDAVIGSGAILNHYWVLVSAFEVKGVTADDLIVRAGSNYSDHGGQEYNVSKIIVNDYYTDQYWYDISLLKTETKIVYSDLVKRISLGYYTPQSNTTAITSGFGGNEEDNGALRSASVTVLSKVTCKEYYSDLPVTLFCATSDTHTQSTLDDFGSPLVQKRVLVGSYLGRIADGPDVYNNIVEWKDWIVATIKKHNN